MEFVIIVQRFENISFAFFEMEPDTVFRSHSGPIEALAKAMRHFFDDIPGNAVLTVKLITHQTKVDMSQYEQKTEGACTGS